jgi:C-terminal processing protease CtpA/Prc
MRLSAKMLSICILPLLLVPLGCRDDLDLPRKTGKLGIVVPVGEGKVKPESVTREDGVVDGPYVISGVYEGSPAYEAGIRPDDVILQVNGVDIEGKRYNYVYNELLLGPPGTRVTLLVKRGDKTMVFDIVRGE